MPRSTYVYVVVHDTIHPANKGPVAAFTVKYELLGWLAGNPGPAGTDLPYDLDRLSVWRLRDGHTARLAGPERVGTGREYLDREAVRS